MKTLDRVRIVGLVIASAYLAIHISGCQQREHVLEYRVKADIIRSQDTSTSALITFQNEMGGTSQEQAILPWSRTMNWRPDSFAYVSAQSMSEGRRVLKVEIYLDGKLVKYGISGGE